MKQTRQKSQLVSVVDDPLIMDWWIRSWQGHNVNLPRTTSNTRCAHWSCGGTWCTAQWASDWCYSGLFPRNRMRSIYSPEVEPSFCLPHFFFVDKKNRTEFGLRGPCVAMRSLIQVRVVGWVHPGNFFSQNNGSKDGKTHKKWWLLYRKWMEMMHLLVWSNLQLDRNGILEEIAKNHRMASEGFVVLSMIIPPFLGASTWKVPCIQLH